MNLLLAAALAVMEDPPAEIDPTTGRGPEWGKAAPIGLLVILLMAIATFLLLRSMVRKINKVPPSFDPPEPDPTAPPAPAEPSSELPDDAGAGPGSTGLVDRRSGSSSRE